MLSPFYSSQFERDVKRLKKRGKDLAKLEEMVTLLIQQQKLPLRNKDHTLQESLRDFRECHIEPDWLLIYKISTEGIYFTRSGSHSDLFR
ncbi:MAG: type II toxin-antitoxin system YafQ family toxin [Chlamydiae bacterium]|nr:type II toxin-antitoxin system YafQ family toxin [Chlamydiota bacterium]MBI3265970.1 type II toxin-antitoxin system YafQ family toxin [Chlamydiota bacterium]